MPYQLLLDQLVYTSFTATGFRTLASGQIPVQIQQAFIEHVVYQHWNSYKPPKSGYRAVYLHQVTPEHNLFGWVYNDGSDDMNRRDVPYFICYYLAEPLLFYFQLETIFSCLHKGPIALIDRHCLPAALENIVVQNFWSYQSARPGVAIPATTRAQNHIALKQGELLDLFLSINEQEMLIELNAQTDEQQIANLAIYTRQLVKTIETGEATINEDAAALKAKVIQPYQGYKKNLQRYEKVFASAVGREHTLSENTHKNLKRLQQVLQLRNEDIEQIEARSLRETLPSFTKGLDKSAKYKTVLPYKNSRLLLLASIAAMILVVFGSIYGLVQTRLFAPNQQKLIKFGGYELQFFGR